MLELESVYCVNDRSLSTTSISLLVWKLGALSSWSPYPKKPASYSSSVLRSRMEAFMVNHPRTLSGALWRLLLHESCWILRQVLLLLLPLRCAYQAHRLLWEATRAIHSRSVRSLSHLRCDRSLCTLRFRSTVLLGVVIECAVRRWSMWLPPLPSPMYFLVIARSTVRRIILLLKTFGFDEPRSNCVKRSEIPRELQQCAQIRMKKKYHLSVPHRFCRNKTAYIRLNAFTQKAASTYCKHCYLYTKEKEPGHFVGYRVLTVEEYFVDQAERQLTLEGIGNTWEVQALLSAHQSSN